MCTLIFPTCIKHAENAVCFEHMDIVDPASDVIAYDVPQFLERCCNSHNYITNSQTGYFLKFAGDKENLTYFIDFIAKKTIHPNFFDGMQNIPTFLL